ncbi:MAG: T9SS type A sorting domain-containing protein [Chitinophagales bacterium]
MKKLLLSLFIIFNAISLVQSQALVERNQQVSLARTIDLSDPTIQDWDPVVFTIHEKRKPASDYGNKKELLKALRTQKSGSPQPSNSSSRGLAPAPPVMLNNFTANTAQGTPNDNHIAISNEGKIVSVVNTNYKVYDENGLQIQSKSLSSFANALGFIQNISDPRVVYDPIEDRFVVMFFAGSTSAASSIIVGFSQTNNPAGVWNLYKLSGNPLNDTTWSDYPIVVLSQDDLLFTFNQLKDGEDWKTGFRYSAIWQVDKAKGYAGDTLKYDYWHNIDYNGKPVWNVCPVQGGSTLSGPETYFLSVRPSDLNNDTVFLHVLSDSYQSGNAQFSTKVLKSSLSYGLPPNAKQRGGQYLASNDARVLSAFIENDKIQYVQNCINPQTITSAIYVGEIDHPASAQPQASAQLISNDSVDFGYASIAYAGNGPYDNRAFITCSYSSPDTFPGTAAFYKDGTGNISDMLIVKKGERAVDVLQDSVERWGDYTGIQKKYNEPNTAWLAGSFVFPTQAYRTWIAKIVNTDSSVISGVQPVAVNKPATVFPNPTTEKFSVRFDLPTDNFTRFTLLDANGQTVRVLLEDRMKGGSSVFSFNTQYLGPGVYFLQISDQGKLLQTEKVIIQR